MTDQQGPKQIFETERLRLREFCLHDAQFVISLFNSPGWLRFIGDRNVRTDQQAKDYLLSGPIKSYKENGFGLCLVERKEDGKSIGACGIIKRDVLEIPDIGYSLLPEFSGQGYAYEIASQTATFAKESLKLPCLWAVTDPDNMRSIRLLEKIGFTYNKNIPSFDHKKELLLFTK